MKAWTILLPLAVVLLLLGSCCKVKPFQLFPTEDMYRILDPPPADRNYVACKANGQVCVYPPIFPGLYGQFYATHYSKERRELAFLSERYAKPVNPSCLLFRVDIPSDYSIGTTISLGAAEWSLKVKDWTKEKYKLINGGMTILQLSEGESKTRISGKFSFDVEHYFSDGRSDTIRVTDGVFNLMFDK